MVKIRDIKIIVSDLIKTFGNADGLKVGLFDGNSPLNNYPLQIIINGVTYNRITESDGYTLLNINLPVGNYSTTIKFNGNATYNPATKDVVVRVLSNNIQQQSTKNKWDSIISKIIGRIQCNSRNRHQRNRHVDANGYNECPNILF